MLTNVACSSILWQNQTSSLSAITPCNCVTVAASGHSNNPTFCPIGMYVAGYRNHTQVNNECGNFVSLTPPFTCCAACYTN